MFVSKTIEEIRQAEQANLDKARAKYEFLNGILSALPAATPPIQSLHDFGYCAKASLTFAGADKALQAYALFPPLELADVRGSDQSQKPVSYIRPEERSTHNIRPIFPVVFRQTGRGECSARWWTRVADLDVEVNVINASAALFNELMGDKYTSDSHHFATGSVGFCPRKFAAVQASAGAMAEWVAKWYQFAEEEVDTSALNGRHRRDAEEFVSRHLHKAVASRVLTPELCNKEGLEAYFKSGYGVYSGLERLADLYSEEVLNKLVKFAFDQASQLPAAKKLEEEQLETIRQWMENFFSTYGYLVDGDTTTREYFLWRLKKDTGLDIHLRMMRSAPQQGRIEITPAVREATRFPSWTFELGLNPKRVRPQDIEVEYQ